MEKTTQSLREFLEKYGDDDEELAAFYWCEPIEKAPTHPWYCCVILVPHTASRPAYTEEFRDRTPASLRAQMLSAGVDAPPIATIRSMCESAPRNRWPRRRRRR